MKNGLSSKLTTLSISVMAAMTFAAQAKVADTVVEQQRAALAESTKAAGFGPQSPRDIDQHKGTNPRVFSMAPERSQMNLCNIHFHAGAEHKGGEFTTYAGNGDGKGFDSGYLYDGELNDAELAPVSGGVCAAKGNPLQSGDTIEVHYVFSSAQITPGPTLGACLDDNTMNPNLRVEGQVMVLVNDDSAHDFVELAKVGQMNGYHQAPNIPSSTGEPVEYLGSTTGPSYNEKGSPLQVSWSVRPNVAKVNIDSVGQWCDDNQFNEDHAHGVRNLVINPALLSPIH